MISFPLLVSLTLLPFVTAQTTAGQLQVQAIEANLQNSGVVPTLLSTFDPTGVLNVSFSGVGAISPGQALTQDQVQPTPNLLLTPANSSVSFSGNYTVVMADAGPVGTDETQGQTRHWLVNSVTLDGSSAPFNVSTSDGNAITEYAGPAPPAGSGPHRYVILIYTQPSTFTSPDNVGSGVETFSLSDYVQASGLGPIIAGNYFTVESGTASFTPSATSAVITSTLPAAESTSSSAKSASTSTESGKANGAEVLTPSFLLMQVLAAVLAPVFGFLVL